jgi:peroxiredoxin
MMPTHQFKKSVFCATVLAGLLAASPVSGDELNTSPSDSTAVLDQPPSLKIKVPDTFGRSRSLQEFADKEILVVAFLGTECPLARLYGPRLSDLAKEFADRSVAVVGVNANVQDSLTEVSAYIQRHQISFPFLLDTDHRIADALQAQRTPEVFVLDSSRQVRYRGRIDDQYGISIQRSSPTRRDLAVAINELLDGKQVTVASTVAVGCHIGRKVTVEPHGDITWSRHVAPIFYRRCVECHRDGQIAPFALTSFEETVGWGQTIAEVIEEERMPPWNANPEFGTFSNDCRLTDQEKEQVLTWVDNGCPKGDPADLPAAPQFADGWRMPQPDQVVYMREKEFNIPAEGVVEYQYWEVDPKFEEDKYITAVEAKPDNTAVVHHIIAYMRLPGEKNPKGLGSMLIGYAPGTSPLIFPEGTAMRVPAGTKFIFELHYTPNGEPQTDRSYVGMKFTDRDNVKRLVTGSEVLNSKFSIDPGASNYEVTAQKRIKADVDLLSLTPHMHLRGKSFRYEAIYPDGQREVLLDVPRYDFNWQLRYEFAEPKRLTKGTRILCTAHFDNSTANPNNPDPTRAVGWGQQSWDEMMIGFWTGLEVTQ